MTQPAFATETFTPDNLIYDPRGLVTDDGYVGPSQDFPRGAVLGRLNHRYSLEVVGTDGTLKLAIGEDETAAIDHDATAADVQTALEALVGAGNVVCAGGVLGTNPVTIQFVGDLAGAAVALTADGDALVGEGAGATLTDVSDGAEGQYVQSKATATDGSERPVAISAEPVLTAGDETQKITVYLAGRFNENRIHIDDSHTMDAVKNVLRPLGFFIKPAVPEAG